MEEALLVREIWLAEGFGHHVCPFCGPRKAIHRGRKDLSIDPADRPGHLCWHCFHCGASGIVQVSESAVLRLVPKTGLAPKTAPEISLPDQREISKTGAEWLACRGISTKTAMEAGCWTRITARGNEAICFPYVQEAPAIKIRNLSEKGFYQEGSASTFWGSESIIPDQDLVIVEGEMDRLALLEVGINSVSIPNGAPQTISERKIDPANDRKYSYVWAGKSLFDHAPRIILAVDNDAPGQALAEELARRIGKIKCWKVEWPDGIKDANDALLQLGALETERLIKNPVPWPVEGIYSLAQFRPDVEALYDSGLSSGLGTGWGSVDDLFTVCPGHLVLITGTPGSGKSAWINALMVNLSQSHSWRWAVQSSEFDPPIHAAMLAALKCGKPFHDGPTPRMTKGELAQALDWVNDHFTFLRSDAVAGVDDTLERLSAACLRYGIRGFVIDPVSYLRMDGDAVEAVGPMLEGFKNFAVQHDCAAILVAHPHKMHRREDGSETIPTGYSVSGSAHYYNRPDCGLTIHRPADDRSISQVIVWKGRFSWLYKEGKAELFFDAATGRYSEQSFFMAPTKEDLPF